MNAQRTLDRFLAAIAVAGTATVAVGTIALTTDRALGGFLAPAFAGGLLLAIVLFIVNRHTAAPAITHDAFAHAEFGRDILNMAHVRVAGVGGLALVAFCAVVTWQYELVSAAMLAGLVGGIAIAWLMLRRRRPA